MLCIAFFSPECQCFEAKLASASRRRAQFISSKCQFIIKMQSVLTQALGPILKEIFNGFETVLMPESTIELNNRIEKKVQDHGHLLMIGYHTSADGNW